MKKTVLTLLSVVAFSATIPAFADTREAQSSNNFNGPQYDRVYSHRYNKTVTRYYNGAIPQTIYYSEYSNGFNSTFSGTLVIQSVRRSNNGAYVTYSGTLSGFWN